jgi:hypothetical protein
LFRSEIFFRTEQELEYFFFLSRKARNFFPAFSIRLYDKNSESDYFFFLHQNQNIFFSNIGKQNIFLEKKSITLPPPFKLNGRSLTRTPLRYSGMVKLSKWWLQLNQNSRHASRRIFCLFLWLGWRWYCRIVAWQYEPWHSNSRRRCVELYGIKIINHSFNKSINLNKWWTW